MLPKQFRLKNKAAFSATYRIKNSFHKGGITLFAGKKKKEETPTRVGFVVSKKTHKRAVKRNRLRRLMRESYRLLLKENICSNKYISIVFTASTKLLDKNFQEIDNTMRKLIKLI